MKVWCKIHKEAIKFWIIIIAVAALITSCNLRKNYNWVYRDFLNHLCDVENGSNIDDIEFLVSNTPVSFIDVTIYNKKITEEEALQMRKDIIKRIEEHVPNADKMPLNFDSWNIALNIKVYEGGRKSKPIYNLSALSSMKCDDKTREPITRMWTLY